MLYKLALIFPLRWRHNGHGSVSNHQPRDCFLNRLFRHRSKKTSKLRVTGLCAGNSPEAGEFPAQMASNAENASIWWRHHAQEMISATLTRRVLRYEMPIHVYISYKNFNTATQARCVINVDDCFLDWTSCIDSSPPGQNGRHFGDDIFLSENVSILIKILLKFIPNGPINNIPALVQIMAWRWPGDKPLSEPMPTCSLTHICGTARDELIVTKVKNLHHNGTF